MEKFNKPLVFGIAGVLILFLIGGGIYLVRRDKDHQGGGDGSNKCASLDYKLKSVEGISAAIFDKDENGNLVVTEKNSVSYDELKDLMFGSHVKGLEDDYYVTYELCDLSDDTAVSGGTFEKVTSNLESKQSGGSTSSGGTGFYTKSDSGDEDYYVEAGRRYAINVFAATTDGDWEWVSTYEFDVTK